MADRPFRRAAKDAVNDSGICWVIMIAGESAGMRVRTAFKASVPPVDEPMKTTLSGAVNELPGNPIGAGRSSARRRAGA